MLKYINLIRMKHWIKNLFIFIPFFLILRYRLYKTYNTKICMDVYIDNPHRLR